MSTIASMLADYPPLSELSGAALEPMASSARIEQFEAGERILRTGDPADTFYVLRHGRVAVEVPSSRGGSIIIETLEPGEVLGISWMLPPYRVTFDARCVEQCGVIAIDAAALRAACDADPSLGYTLYKHLSGVVRDRLQATRMQLLDLYGGSHGG
jgi:CRP/FNR family cyclic AMP-dependent transcriptional regulator